MRDLRRTIAALCSAPLFSIAAFAQSDTPRDPWSELASELAGHQEIPSDAQRDYVQSVAESIGSHAIATAFVVGDFDRRERIQRQVFEKFQKVCGSLGGQIRDAGQPGQIRTRATLTSERVFFHLGDRQNDNAGMLICDADRQAISALIAVHQVNPQWSSITLLDPAIVVSEAMVEAEQRAASEQRWREHEAWQRSVGEGEMTGCGRILTARPQIVEIADRITGQTRWVERSELNQPSEGCGL